MREIRPSGSMSGEWKRSLSHRATFRLYIFIILSYDIQKITGFFRVLIKITLKNEFFYFAHPPYFDA